MKVILHGEGKEKTMHLTQTDQFQNKIIVKTWEFSYPPNKWEQAVAVDRDQIYEFAYHDGTHYHYRLCQ